MKRKDTGAGYKRIAKKLKVRHKSNQNRGKFSEEQFMGEIACDGHVARPEPMAE